MKMSVQKCFTAVIFALSAVSLNASAAIINNVDFPDAFVHAKEKTIVADQEQVTASADVQK